MESQRVCALAIAGQPASETQVYSFIHIFAVQRIDNNNNNNNNRNNSNDQNAELHRRFIEENSFELGGSLEHFDA